MTQNQPAPVQERVSNAIVAAGTILAISYPVLALSTGVRAIYQIYRAEPENSPWLTLLAAALYLAATVGFVKRQGWAWKLSVGTLGFETLLTLIVGTLSVVAPDVFGRNVWQYFGRDYGYFPLFQPLLGIAWLFHPATLRLYGRRRE
jgi:hypothetical protein